MSNIIIRSKERRLGRHRSEQEKNLRKEGMITMTDEQLDKCKYLEKRGRNEENFKCSYFDQRRIDKVGK